MGELRWLAEWKDTKEKKALLAKVRFLDDA